MERAAIQFVLRTLETMPTIEWADDDGGTSHFEKHRGDLPPGATLADYEDRIFEVVRQGGARVYLDPDDGRGGGAIAIVGDIGAVQWFVKVHSDVTVRTAYPPVDGEDAYMEDCGYPCLGTIRELRR